MSNDELVPQSQRHAKYSRFRSGCNPVDDSVEDAEEEKKTEAEMRCYVCDEVEKFHSLKELNPDRELLVCKGCGNVCYRVEPDEEEKMKNYYRFDYRPQPNWMNLLTCAHKLQYIAAALKGWLEGKKELVCGDVGTAIGYIPNWLRKMGHEVYGSEFTVTFRRFAEHFYGVKVHEELPEKQYDLITIYHVLEHMIDPDKKLAHYAAMLKPEGRILVATPEWFEVLEEASGSNVTDFVHLFHKDHINVFSQGSLKRLFNKCGLIPETEEHRIYGQTYLLRKGTPAELKAYEYPFDLVEEQIEKIKKNKQAIDLLREKKFREALNVWPKFPEAWIGLICEQNMKNPERQVDLWKECLSVMGDNLKIIERYAIWLYQNEEWEKALAEIEKVLKTRPHENLFIYAGWCFSHLDRPVEAMQAFQRASDMLPMKWQESMDWICREACSMPNWQEIEDEAEKERVWKDHKTATSVNA